MEQNKFFKFGLCILACVFIVTGFAFPVSSKEKASKEKLKVGFVYAKSYFNWLDFSFAVDKTILE